MFDSMTVYKRNVKELLQLLDHKFAECIIFLIKYIIDLHRMSHIKNPGKPLKVKYSSRFIDSLR